MRGLEKFIRAAGAASLTLLIASIFGAMLAPFIPGDPEFWTTSLLWLSISTMVVAPGVFITFTDIGRVRERPARRSIFPDPEPFDPSDFDGPSFAREQFEEPEPFANERE